MKLKTKIYILIALLLVPAVFLVVRASRRQITTSETGLIYVKTYRISSNKGLWLSFWKNKTDTVINFMEALRGYYLTDELMDKKGVTYVMNRARSHKLTIYPIKKYNRNVRLDENVVDIEIFDYQLLDKLWKEYHNIVLYELVKIEVNDILLKERNLKYLEKYGIKVHNVRYKRDMTFEQIYKVNYKITL